MLRQAQHDTVGDGELLRVFLFFGGCGFGVFFVEFAQFFEAGIVAAGGFERRVQSEIAHHLLADAAVFFQESPPN